jgi:carbamoyltransferase
MDTAFLGPSYPNDEIESFLKEKGVPYHDLGTDDEVARTGARLIAANDVVGWFQGRMEFGPRALGSRSIIADARDPKNKDVVNLKIKFRESFRPFAPSVLEEKVGDYFELDRPSPFMLLVAQVREDRRTIPAVTHVDGSARVQTVSREQNPLYHQMISEFDRLTGCPVIINTSFNVRGEPIVCSPDDALRCFLRTHMDHLLIGRFHLDKSEMPAAQDVVGRLEEFAPD